MAMSDYHVVGDPSLARPVPAPPVDADNVVYDNTSSGITATNVQDALDELASGSGGGAVTGVKGDSESTYRTGNVNITKANIGLSDVNNTSDADKPISTATQIALNGKLDTSLKGANSGLAELDSNGKVPNSQLPGYVDDVLEYASLSVFPATGESGKIYVALDTNKTYRWSGTTYIEISPSLALGETSSTAYRGDRGKIAYDHSQSDHSSIAPAFSETSTRTNITSGDTIATLFGKIKKFFSDLKTVAFTGSYTDLTDKPTIPTVNNATLTIQKNGANVQTFTANQSTNTTANITVPTKTSDLTNDSGFKTGTYAGSQSDGGPANNVIGTYSGSGGQQGPSYYGKNRVGFLMSNATVSGDSHYKNWMYMDNYDGSDVGGATAFGIDRTEPRAFIMQSDANRTSWNNSAPLGVFTATPTTGQVVVTDGTTGGVKSSGYTIAKSVPSNAVFTDTTTGTTYTAGNAPANTTFATNGSVKSAYDALLGKLTWTLKSDTSRSIFCKYLNIGDYKIVFITQGITGCAITNQYGSLYYRSHIMTLTGLGLSIAGWETIDTSVIANTGLVHCSVHTYNTSELGFFITDSKNETLTVTLQVVGLCRNS